MTLTCTQNVMVRQTYKIMDGQVHTLPHLRLIVAVGFLNFRINLLLLLQVYSIIKWFFRKHKQVVGNRFV